MLANARAVTRRRAARTRVGLTRMCRQINTLLLPAARLAVRPVPDQPDAYRFVLGTAESTVHWDMRGVDWADDAARSALKQALARALAELGVVPPHPAPEVLVS